MRLEDDDRIIRRREIGEGGKFALRGELVTFADGSQLIVYSRVKDPPRAELTERPSMDLDVGLETTDRGIWEAEELADASTAGRVREAMLALLNSVPGPRY